ncbi:hypothetical protein MMYC01_204211 [Madurella mycetomatis]|uniref:Uncharacterized protein n=1 Tax=Madurella mycetomatis TaxID=100816 RepID=A0A175W4E5_9PEZI|nr:hypothetical protein MMYC01_204211 [Madurella mycetomatis]
MADLVSSSFLACRSAPTPHMAAPNVVAMGPSAAEDNTNMLVSEPLLTVPVSGDGPGDDMGDAGDGDAGGDGPGDDGPGDEDNSAMDGFVGYSPSSGENNAPYGVHGAYGTGLVVAGVPAATGQARYGSDVVFTADAPQSLSLRKGMMFFLGFALVTGNIFTG